MKKAITLVSIFLLFSILLTACCNDKKAVSSVVEEIPTVTVTFPEGLNVMQYGKRLEENGVCTAQEFYDAMNTIDYGADYPFLPVSEILDEREYKLEGYLYPDTYEFYFNTSGETVVRKMLDNFKVRVADELYETPSYSRLSFDECVTLAAIVEKETPVTEEKPKIAAVFINRLKSNDFPKLQSDTTWYYPYTKETEPEGFKSDYNTYRVDGLPKGAICNPSRSSIEAVILHDTDFTGYYYFFTDDNNKHYYAKTYKEHQKNVEYCKENGLYTGD